MEDWQDFVARVAGEFGELRFRRGRKFAFRPPRTILIPEQDCLEKCSKYGKNEYNFLRMQLLHEVGHALLGHRDWKTDLMRVKMECAAWAKARELCERYGVRYDEDFAEGELDSYRDWLHQRSRCKKCGLTRYQGQDGKYHCPGCEGML